jgi:AmiR/NasT family two-component response regulator
MLSALSVFIDRALTAYRTAHGGPISTALLQRELQDRELIARAIQCLTVREQIGCDQARTLLLRSAHQRGTTTLTAARRVLRGCPIEVSTNPDPSHQPLAEEVAGR